MRINHAFLRRIIFCLGACLALLGYVPIAFAAKATLPLPAGKVFQSSAGNTATVAFESDFARLISKPVTAMTPSLGGSGGWSMASNFGTRATTAGGLELATAAEIQAGRSAFQALLTGNVSKAALAASEKASFMAIGRLAGPLGMAFTAASVIDYLAQNQILENPDKADKNNPFLLKKLKPGTAFRVRSTDPWSASEREACSVMLGSFTDGVQRRMGTYSPGCTIESYNAWLNEWSGQVYGYQTSNEGVLSYFPAGLAEIEPYLTRPATAPLPTFIDETERIRQAHPDAGIEPFRVDLDQGVKLTGPASVGEPTTETTTSTKTNPDGSTTTTTTTKTKTLTATYSGDKVTVTEKEKVTTVERTCTESGTCTETNPNPDEDTEKPAAEETDLCKLHPDILACKEIDTPEAEIPRSSKELTYTEDAAFSGGGSCPADKTMTLHTGQFVKVWDWQQSCTWIVNYVRPVLLVIAAYIAVMILVPQS